MIQIDPFIKELFDDHRKYLVSTCNLIALSITDKSWAAVKHNMSRHIKYNITPESLVDSIIAPCGFVPASFPIIFNSHLQLPVQYIVDPIEEHATVASFIYLNPIWTSISNGELPNVGHRITVHSSDSSELWGLIYLKSDELKQRFKEDEPTKYWNDSLDRLKINNYDHTYYGDNK